MAAIFFVCLSLFISSSGIAAAELPASPEVFPNYVSFRTFLYVPSDLRTSVPGEEESDFDKRMHELEWSAGCAQLQASLQEVFQHVSVLGFRCQPRSYYACPLAYHDLCGWADVTLWIDHRAVGRIVKRPVQVRSWSIQGLYSPSNLGADVPGKLVLARWDQPYKNDINSPDSPNRFFYTTAEIWQLGGAE